MRRLIKAALVAVLLTSVPALAHGGHGGWRDGDRHHQRHWKQGHHKKNHGHARHWRERRQVVEHVYRYEPEPYPTQSASVSPGIHVIFPDVFFPWSQ